MSTHVDAASQEDRKLKSINVDSFRNDIQASFSLKVTQGCQLSRIWRDSHAFDLLLTQLTNLLTHSKEITRILTQFYKTENNLIFLIIVTFVRLV